MRTHEDYPDLAHELWVDGEQQSGVREGPCSEVRAKRIAGVSGPFV